ncbi:pentapeptide repeat-containing protein [Halobacteriovorax sp. ZH4_bin.1]|uniref:pentapeptide repeat-containing protein n=1 Tax=unclassified Halobacteriovorax TaxID=2639665 RepID=UPI0037223A28
MPYFEDEVFDTENISEVSEFRGSEFICCEFVGVDISELDASSAKFIECTFKNCNLSNLKLLGASFRDVTFVDSKCIGLNFSDCNTLFELKFNRSILNYASFQDCTIHGAQFISSTLSETDFTQGSFESSDFSDSDLQGTNFTRANLKGSKFLNARNFYIDIANTNLKNCKFSMPEVLNLLSPFGIEIE